MSKYVMALDAGTTSNRCILFNKKGEICKSGHRSPKIRITPSSALLPAFQASRPDPASLQHVFVCIGMEAGQRRASCFCMKDIGISVTCRPWHWKTNRKRTARSSQDPGGIGGLHRTDLHKQVADLEKQSRTGLHSRPGIPGRHRPKCLFPKPRC